MGAHNDHATWVSLTAAQLTLLRSLLNRHNESAPLIAVLDQYEAPEAKDQSYRDAAQDLPWVRDGECEIDDYAVVSGSDDGAYVMAWVWVDRKDAIHTARCDNCLWSGDVSELDPVRDIEARLDVGGVVPAGECPECGCLAYLVDDAEEVDIHSDRCDHGA